MNEMNIIERAFEVAPECGSVSEVRQILVREGYFNVEAHLTGRQIQRDIQNRLDPERRAYAKARTQRPR
jgi:hypothetical protein